VRSGKVLEDPSEDRDIDKSESREKGTRERGGM